MAPLRVGAGIMDITPAPGVHLSGSGMGDHRPARRVLDPLHAKAVVFESGDQRLCLISMDVTIVAEPYTARIRRAVSDRFGIPPQAIMVHGLQTHSAPSVGAFMLDPDFPLAVTPQTEYLLGCETAYCDWAADRAVEAAAMAFAGLRPVRIGVGRGILGDIAFNRRGIRRDGGIMMPKPQGREAQPLGPVELCFLEGPIDPEVGVMIARAESGEIAAAILHYTCHPVNVFGDKQTYLDVSSDWPGTWSAGVQEALGSGCVPLVINGCCGNINPWHPYDPEAVPDHRRMGRQLTDMTRRIVDRMEYRTTATLDWRMDRILLPLRPIPAGRLEEARRILAESPGPKWGTDGSADVDPRWFRAATTMSVEYCRRRGPEFPYEIQAFRIGDAAIIGLPGEPFVEGQLALKTRSAAPFPFVAHMVTQYVGYLPTREAFLRGGHEANEDVTYWAKLGPGALDAVVARAREMVADLFSSVADAPGPM